ncbi:MAG: hypothetical protein P1U70_06250 [Saprospiraceae bacterium]|jgi:archaellum component FlaC|nr:hypothetical protein [Saprospiraceae bacterium]
MAEITNDLMYEVLKDIRGTLKEHSEHFRMVNQRLEAIEHHMAGFHITVSHHQEEIAGLKLRLERLEKRLEIRDT